MNGWEADLLKCKQGAMLASWRALSSDRLVVQGHWLLEKCTSLLGLLQQDTTDWGAYTTEIYFLTTLEAEV